MASQIVGYTSQPALKLVIQPTLVAGRYNGSNWEGPWPNRTFSILNLRLDGELLQKHILAFLADQD